MSQVAFEAIDVLAGGSKKNPPHLVFANNLLLLPLCVGASIVILALTYILPRIYRLFAKWFTRSDYEQIGDEEDDVDEAAPTPVMPSGGLASDFKRHIRTFREAGSLLFVLEIIRTLCLCALLGLSIWAAIRAESPETESLEFDILKKHKKGKKHKGHKGHHDKSTIDDYSSLEWGEFGTCAFYAYTLIFSFLLLTLRPGTPLRRQLITHLDTLLFLAFGLYAYRDFWPLLTTYLVPVDINFPTTWARLGILTGAAVIIPLVRPRTYIPVDPLNPTPPGQIHPEQVAPVIFYIFYEFMTSLVWKAWNSPSLPYEQLHPLADYDEAEHLYKKHVANLDPVSRQAKGLKQRHLFFGILTEFRWDLFITVIMCTISGAAELSGSLGINRLLAYLEKGYDSQGLRPIVWIALLFLGPLIGSLSIQYYIFIMTRALVRMESIFTQLLFDHALRLRMKDSLGDEEEKKEEDSPGVEPAAAPQITIQEVTDSGAGNIGGLVGDELRLDDNEQNNGKQTQPSSTEGTEVGSSSGSNKGKGAAPAASAAKKEIANRAPEQGIAGRINVLMAADVESVVDGRDIPLIAVYAPVQLILCIWFLYAILSWSAFVGMAFILITLPLPGFATKWNAQYQQKRMVATDSRVDVITEAVGALRMLKLFGWEDRMKERISAKRDEELHLIFQRRLMYLITTFFNIVLPVITMALTFSIYTVVEKKQLTAATVFSSMTVFETLKGQMGMVFYLVNEQVTAWVSLQRINKFMNTTEMIDVFVPQPTVIKPQEQLEAESEGLIRLHDATFTWGSSSGTSTPGFGLYIEDATFIKGKINLITGPTGSGKSSLLKALISELHFINKEGAFFHLPREGGVSYAAQESWCLSETIKDNIIFGEPFDLDRYNAVIKACALETDLKILDDGDQTEIGEKGVTLSGGQKARVTLARAVYSQTDVVLLDDIFSALDTLTSRWIIDHLFKGELMKGRTVLLVTHHVGLVARMADYMLSLDDNGTVISAGPIDAAEISEEEEEEAKIEAQEIKEEKNTETAKPEETKKASKLVQIEEKAEGRISKRAMLRFFGMFGGPIFWSLYWGLLIAGTGMAAWETYWLGLWARAYDHASDPSEVSVTYWLGLYGGFVVIGLVMLGGSAVLFNAGAVRASREMHKRLVDRIFGAYMRFLDSTPVGRIVSRFTKDMKSIDGNFVDTFAGVAEISIGMIIKFISVIALVPFFTFPALAIGFIGGILGELYIHGQLSVKREMSNAKSPLFSHFSAAVNGIVSIRAFGAQEKLRAEARRRADKYTRAATAFYNLNRWVTVRIDMLGGIFAASLSAFLVYGKKMDASTAGFALSQAISFSQMILWWVRMVNQMEVEGNSVERIEDYLVIEQEPAYKPEKNPPAAWPTSGEIILDKLSAKYSNDGPTVLKELEVTIKSGEKVGIVGRTGSGKSTLALALLRMIPTTGSVVVDGIKTERINLQSLRTSITIIPQDPVLLSGSMRFNLDPFGDHDDAELNDAMQASGLGSSRTSSSGAATPQRLTLDSPIAAGGGNLSQGQRQLVALARALVRNSKVFILDEATASVDFETDALIQKSIRNLPSHCTVLTVAHRLATVMDYDKIMVLGAGKLLEYDSPENLKKNKDSYFAKLVQAMEG